MKGKKMPSVYGTLKSICCLENNYGFNYIYGVGEEIDITNNNISAIIGSYKTNGEFFWSKKYDEKNKVIAFNYVTKSIEEGKTYVYIAGYEKSLDSNHSLPLLIKRETGSYGVWSRCLFDKNLLDTWNKYDSFCNEFTSVTVTKENNETFVYAVGYTKFKNGKYKSFITKWNRVGDLVWVKELGNEDIDISILSVTSTVENGNVYIYVSGKERNWTDIREWNSNIIKFNTKGRLVWWKYKSDYENNSFNNVITSVENDKTYVYTVGYKGSNATISKYDSNGFLFWDIEKNNKEHSVFNSAIISVENKKTYIYTVGYEVDQHKDNRVHSIITKWDSKGNLVWEKTLYNGNSDCLYSIINLKNENTNVFFASGNTYIRDKKVPTIVKFDTEGNIILLRNDIYLTF